MSTFDPKNIGPVHSRTIRFCLTAVLATMFCGKCQAQDPQQDGDKPPANATVSVVETIYGQTANGEDVRMFSLTNRNGWKIEMMTYGATMISFQTPDRDGKMKNIILTCPNLAAYQKGKSYFGCTAGRYCNRIALGKFSIDGKEYTLATNNGPNHLHGGNIGFDKINWNAEMITEANCVGVRFTHTSPDGDEGYPGTVNATAEYRLNNDNELLIDLYATTDAPTHVSLTNHNYWNLAGEGTILDHVLTLNCDQYLPVDDTMIPTGELKSVEGTPMDFREPTPIGKRIEPLRATSPKGYDHCFVVKRDGNNLVPVATVADPSSGRVMQVWTDQPGLQFYSGNFLDGSEGSGGYAENSACCLESEFFPDTPNHPNFPSSLLKPGDTYHSRTVHKFSIQK